MFGHGGSRYPGTRKPSDGSCEDPERLQAENDQREERCGEQTDEARDFKCYAQANSQIAKDAWEKMGVKKNGA